MTSERRQLLAKEAIQVQDACNPSGVAHFLMEVFEMLHDEGADTAAKCNDPIIRIVVSKLADLCRVNGVDEYGIFSQSYKRVKEIANES